MAAIAASEEPGFAFAELLDRLGPLSAREFEEAVAEPPAVRLDPYWSNYVAATVEHGAASKGEDVEDVRYLVRNLGLRRLEDAKAILAAYYPLEQYPPTALAALEEILSSG